MSAMLERQEASLIEDRLFRLWWPVSRLGEAIEQLARRGGLHRQLPADPLSFPAEAEAPGELRRWLDWASGELGLEAVEVEAPAAELDRLLLGAGPALILHRSGTGLGFFALLGRRRGRALFLAPDLSRRAVPLAAATTLLCRHLEEAVRPEIEHVLDAAGVSGGRRGAIAAALVRERLAGRRIGNVFLLRLPSSAPLPRQLGAARAWPLLAGILAVFAFSYMLEIGGWGLIGSGALAGRIDRGWLAAWALVLVTLLAARVAGAWLESRFALTVGRVLRARLLAGALALRPDAVKRDGAGQTIGRVIESQALESLSLNGGLTVLVAALELAFSAWVLLKGAAPAAHLILLALFAFAAGVGGWRFYGRLRRWSGARLDMTNRLIESMVGHRTRLAQERAERREAQDDAAVQAYLGLSADMDKGALLGVSSLGSLWMLAGILTLLPAFTAPSAPATTALAISLGGLFLAQRALGGIAGGLAGLTRALVAWQQVKPIFAAARPRAGRTPFLPAGKRRDARCLLDAEELSFAYPGRANPVLQGASLAIDQGDHILLQGASGGGKSTLAALLTGLELPASGLLLLDGLDRPSLGDNWHRLATSAPQFHENHILSGTLAFNLLMGRQWPARDDDIAEAEALCEELGLGELLRRMPGGINQRVGETGWQLSHGERSRIFLARALLQRAELTVMDESFGALDPETLERCLDCARRHASTIVVIAHP